MRKTPNVYLRRAQHLAAVLVLTMLVGCASSPDRVAFNSIDGAISAAQAGVAAFKTLYNEGVKSPDPVVVQRWKDNDVKARAAYAKFQKAALVATDVAAGLGQKDSALTIVSNAYADLIETLRAFGVK